MVQVCAVALLLVGASVAYALDISQCIAPLGMESGHIPDRDISASSCYNDGNVAPQNGRLNQDIKGGAWCPRKQISTEYTEWLEVELRDVHVLTATAIQGRFGNGQGQEYAEAYVLEYWRPRLNKWVRYRMQTGQEVLRGNTNTYLQQKNPLTPAVWADKLRFIPFSSHRRTVCLRVEIYGCHWNTGIVAYSMPQGDKRSNGVELFDTSYDGSWAAGVLRGGLGQLVDGVFGSDDIREAARPSAWVGWRNDSQPPVLTFEFDRVREFTAVHIYCNNKYMRDVQVFSSVTVRFSVGGRQYQEEAVLLAHAEDTIFETARNVTVRLHHRIARFVRLELRFAARWILISEVVFESVVAQGNYSAETPRPATERGVGAEAPVSTARREDPLYVAIVVGVLTALIILVSVAVFLLVHRHRHRKCFTSPLTKAAVASHQRTLDNYSACGASTLPAGKAMLETALDMKSDEYQEPYQPIKCAPYFAYSSVLLEMQNFANDDRADDGSNYEYAVPEVSAAPLLSRRHLDELPAHDLGSLSSVCSFMMSQSQEETVMAVRRRLETTSVLEFPRHRLRMISKLAEGSFGTVYVAEADGVPQYDGALGAQRSLVAVKFLSQDASRMERGEFERDVRILAALAHPGLARVLGACRAPPLAVVLEYLEGGDLCAWLRAAPPPPHAALLHIAAQIAAAMRYLEALNFVHRDLAARNCLIGPDYQIKVSDFCTDNEAYACDYVPGRSRAPLPLRWAAWECVLAGKHSTRADVWAFGITLHELFTLCRRRPYERMSDDEVLRNLRHLQADDGLFSCVERAAACPRDVYELMRECWRRDELARPTFREAHEFLAHRAATAAAAPPS